MIGIEFDAQIALTVDEHGYLKVVEGYETDDLDVESLEINADGILMDIDEDFVKYALQNEEDIVDVATNDNGEVRVATIWIKLEELEEIPTFRVVE